ncbi:uncharacterized protein ARMOST_21267 [Armillaria ostoyae]|uniref:Uncharacterized protein n=1 Tax=Armillaria ostoyae TaxID=47428 RepID=A0A284S9L9_ARMOS|nr:uncharacterized protein ARMOST_21267 [Armillaria ostoyae]
MHYFSSKNQRRYDRDSVELQAYTEDALPSRQMDTPALPTVRPQVQLAGVSFLTQSGQAFRSGSSLCNSAQISSVWLIRLKDDTSSTHSFSF